MTYEGVRLKVLEMRRKAFARRRSKKLKCKEFTIISNNCWGGMVYESYGLPKQSPTVGLFFMADDYLKFISDLKGYINSELRFIEPSASKWKDAPEISGDKRCGTYPIGLLSNGIDEVEIFFLHFHSKEEAKEKWDRRCARIRWDKLLIKFNDQNGCSEEHIERFAGLDFENKLFFTSKRWDESLVKKFGAGYCYIQQFREREHVLASYEPFGRSRIIDINQVINSL